MHASAILLPSISSSTPMHQPLAANIADERKPFFQSFEPFDEVFAHLHAILEGAGFEQLHHRQTGAASDRIAAEGRCMAARTETVGDIFARQHRAQGQAAAQRLGQSHDVGLDAEMLVAEKLAGAAHAGLHFIEDQQNAAADRRARAGPT